MTLLRWFSRLTWLGACLWLAGCETPLPEVLYPDLRFSHLPPIQLNVARIDVVDGYQSPLREPNVEHKLPLAPVLASPTSLRVTASRSSPRWPASGTTTR